MSQKTFICTLHHCPAQTRFGCTEAELECYLSHEPADESAVRALEVGQKYADSEFDIWERTA